MALKSWKKSTRGIIMPEKEQPIEKEFQKKMRTLGIMLNDILNESGKKEVGFCLLSFKFGEPTEYSRINYISNANRKDMIKALEDFLEREKENIKKPVDRRENNLLSSPMGLIRRKTDKLIH